MNNNDILRRVRYALNIKDNTMVQIFKNDGLNLKNEEVLNFLKKEEEEGYVKCNNKTLEAFLDGLVTLKRGKQEEPKGAAAAESKITQADFNNIVLKKLRIALSFRSEDMLKVLSLGGLHFSESELSAFFRKKDHKNYKACGDKIIRVFLKGLIIYNRGPREERD